MPNTPSNTKLSAEALGRLQGELLEALLTGAPLPGQSHPLNLPDLPLVLQQPAVVVSSENLGGPLSVEGSSKPIYVLSAEAILERAQREGDFLYLQFQPPQSGQNEVRFTLQIQIAQREPGLPVLGLSGIQVTFRQTGRKWQADEETAAFAA